MRAVFEQVIQVPLAVLIALAAFDTGVDAPPPGAPRLWDRPALMVRALAAILIVVPLFAMVVLKLLPLSPVVRGGVMVAILAVGIGPVTLMRQDKTAGREAVDLNLVLMLLSLVYVPAAFALLAHLFNRQLHLGAMAVAKVVLPRALAPLLVGLLVARRWPQAAAKAHPALARLVNRSLPVVLVLLLFVVWRSLRAVSAPGFGACALVAAAALLIGHLFGGPDLRSRAVVANASVMRFPILGLTLAAALPQSERVVAVVVVYLLMAMLALLVYVVVLRRISAPRKRGATKYATA
jgi:BASS family bile acid:Na+ symporter